MERHVVRLRLVKLSKNEGNTSQTGQRTLDSKSGKIYGHAFGNLRS